MQTNDRQITELMQTILTGKAQLPDFQRGWVWDDDRIMSLIASITCNYPVGAAMFLEYGNADIRFKYRVIEGAPADNAVLGELILDGQQRLTSIYSSLFSQKPVRTRTEKNKDKDIFRYYYIDIDVYLASHWIDVSSCRGDDFDTYFVKRASALLDAIETATGKPIFGRNSEDVIKEFGRAL